MNYNVTVLLSSYCGEKYINEQLESLFSQKDIDINLIIRDDGSSDDNATIQKIENFAILHPGKISLIKGKNIGWKKSFQELILYAAKNCDNCEWFAFCDQDDIWLPSKLQKAIKSLAPLSEQKLPLLYCSNLYYYKDGTNFGLIRKSHPVPSPKNCLVRNYATGCTVVFNHRLLELLAMETPKMEIAHDYWAYMTAVLCGKVVVDDDSHVLYRQHDNNLIGCKDSFFDIWKRRLSNIITGDTDINRQQMASELRRILGKHMNQEALAAVSKMADYKKSLYARLLLITDNGFSRNRKSNDFWWKLRILFGKI